MRNTRIYQNIFDIQLFSRFTLFKLIDTLCQFLIAVKQFISEHKSGNDWFALRELWLFAMLQTRIGQY